jgi:hypothetical protein
LLYDADGNPITEEYIEQLSAEAEIGYDLESLTPIRIGRPSLSDNGDSPQIRVRVPATTRAAAKDFGQARRQEPVRAGPGRA